MHLLQQGGKGAPDGRFLPIFACTDWQLAPDGTIWERAISCATPITPSVEEFIYRLCRLYFLNIAGARVFPPAI